MLAVWSGPASPAVAGVESVLVAGAVLGFGYLLVSLVPRGAALDPVLRLGLAPPALCAYTATLMLVHMASGGFVFSHPWVVRASLLAIAGWPWSWASSAGSCGARLSAGSFPSTRPGETSPGTWAWPTSCSMGRPRPRRRSPERFPTTTPGSITRWSLSLPASRPEDGHTRPWGRCSSSWWRGVCFPCSPWDER